MKKFKSILSASPRTNIAEQKDASGFFVLKSGGEAMIGTWGPKSPRLKNKKKECCIPWTVEGIEEKQMRYTYIYELEELVELCESVGFEVVKNWEDRNVNVIVRKSS